MKITKAIQKYKENKGYLRLVLDDDLLNAVYLGLEALKRLKEHREDHIDITYRALLGETPEE